MTRRIRRRTVLHGMTGACLGAGLAGTARAAAPRTLSLMHTHTGRRLDVVYAEGGSYLRDALAAIDRFLKDFRTGDVHPIDPRLLDTLYQLAGAFNPAGEFQVISGFRSPQTNEQLRQTSSGVAKKSYHMQGRAIDVRLTGARLSNLHKAALSLHNGGVGFYPRSDFIHLDTGPVRRWGG